MSSKIFLHHEPEFNQLIQIVSAKEGIDPALIEKDYWIMHCLYGLLEMGVTFQLKGGTSLSKGYGIINRFSEDIDIRVDPPHALRIGTNHDKDKDRKARCGFFDDLSKKISINGIVKVERDCAFDDLPKYRSGGIRLFYESTRELPADLKQGILLEVGFDNVMPNEPKTITSWAYDYANKIDIIKMHDNRAQNILCYDPRYTFIEKLQTISTKYRQQQQSNTFPRNFLRHYYDAYNLLETKAIQEFIGQKEYVKYKALRFRSENKNIMTNEAFMLSDNKIREQYKIAYEQTKSLYYKDRPSFDRILELIHLWAPRL